VRLATEDTRDTVSGTSKDAGAGGVEPAADLPAGALPSVLLGFTHRLRDAGIPVSMVEMLDAVDAVGQVVITDRPAFRAALASTLVKRAEHRAAFDSLFDTYFAVRREAPDVSTTLDRPGEPARESGGEALEPPSTDLLKALLDALRSDDRGALRLLAELAVDEFAGITGARVSSERYYLYRVLRQLELSQLLRQAMSLEREEAPQLSPLAERLLRDEHIERMEEFRRMIAQEIRRQLVERRGTGEAADLFHDRAIEDVEFLRASPTELRGMREAIRPLAQKLAARVARRRRFRRHGRLDVRRTMRRSLSSGGVPLDPAFRYRRASKPELYLLCDISGSVAEFARFTMSLLYAMKAEFSRIRLFAFVDGIDEVTDLMESRGHELAPRNLLYGTKVIAADGHSDYGNVFRRFWQVYGYADLDPRSTVIITGDARSNYRDPGLESFELIAERARKVFWLNPEPRRDWNTTDSIMAQYATRCHGSFEAGNLRQLAEFVYEIT
jgi:uncharacterized protein with von Willebrand factor type A (vWA) domain